MDRNKVYFDIKIIGDDITIAQTINWVIKGKENINPKYKIEVIEPCRNDCGDLILYITKGE